MQDDHYATLFHCHLPLFDLQLEQLLSQNRYLTCLHTAHILSAALVIQVGLLVPTLPDGLEELSLENCNVFAERLSQSLKSLEVWSYNQIQIVGLEEEQTKKIGIQGRFPDSLR
jgi:hypothetical protein